MLQIKTAITVDVVVVVEISHRHVLDEISGVIMSSVPI